MQVSITIIDPAAIHSLAITLPPLSHLLSDLIQSIVSVTNRDSLKLLQDGKVVSNVLSSLIFALKAGRSARIGAHRMVSVLVEYAIVILMIR